MAHTRGAFHSSDASVARALSVNWKIVNDQGAPDFSVNIYVDGRSAAVEPSHFRGMGHLIFARYGSSIFLFDVLRRSVTAWLSAPVAANPEHWAQRFMPLILGVLGPAIGLLPLHSACVANNGRGFLIAGESMAGKSTLSVALAREGVSLLSDDWTYIRSNPQGLLACGLRAPIKLLPDASSHFPELHALTPQRTGNGEVAYELRAPEMLRITGTSQCVPECLFFLERTHAEPAQVLPVAPSYVAQYIENSVERLPPELTAVAATRQSLIAQLSKLPSWRFRYSGPPQHGARALLRFVEQLQEVSQ